MIILENDPSEECRSLQNTYLASIETMDEKIMNCLQIETFFHFRKRTNPQMDERGDPKHEKCQWPMHDRSET